MEVTEVLHQYKKTLTQDQIILFNEFYNQLINKLPLSVPKEYLDLNIQYKCKYLLTNLTQCNKLCNDTFCDNHSKFYNDINNFLGEIKTKTNINNCNTNLNKPKNYDGYNKVFINDTFYYLKNTFIYNYLLEIVGIVKDGTDDYIFQYNPFE
jgi:hypothetical protein